MGLHLQVGDITLLINGYNTLYVKGDGLTAALRRTELDTVYALAGSLVATRGQMTVIVNDGDYDNGNGFDINQDNVNICSASGNAGVILHSVTMTTTTAITVTGLVIIEVFIINNATNFNIENCNSSSDSFQNNKGTINNCHAVSGFESNRGNINNCSADSNAFLVNGGVINNCFSKLGDACFLSNTGTLNNCVGTIDSFENNSGVIKFSTIRVGVFPALGTGGKYAFCVNANGSVITSLP